MTLSFSKSRHKGRKSGANKTRKSLFKTREPRFPEPLLNRGGLRGQGPRGEQKSIRGGLRGFTPVFLKGGRERGPKKARHLSPKVHSRAVGLLRKPQMEFRAGCLVYLLNLTDFAC